MGTPQPAADRENLAGLVERVTFHNEDSGFCVLRVKARGQRDLITVIGHAAAIGAGEFVQASGRWVNDRTHGVQFRADFLRAAPPTTAEGIEKYLASGMIKGIGPVYAKKLVKAFREQVFDVIEQTPERLKEVDGIGPKRADSIVAAWADQKAIREIMIFLHSHGVGTSRAVRIFKTYGADAIRLISENPYRLARDIRGIGFKSADQIAAKLGIEKTAMIRARAGIGYALTEAMDEGHCGLPLAQLVPMAVKLLEVPAEIIETALDLELQDGEVVADTRRRRAMHLPRRPASRRTGDRRADQGAEQRRSALAGHRCREGHPLGRDQGRHHPRCQPAGGGATGADDEGARHHRRPRRRQDDADELDPEDPERQGRADRAGRAHRPRGEAAVRRAPASRRRRSTGCSRSIRCTAASAATRSTRSTAICSSSTRPR